MNREIGLIFIGIEEVDDTWATGSGGQRQTLGSGDNCCDCHYELTGECPIRPNGEMK